jgi:4-hydroxybutyrate CoA-transferase
MLGLGTDDLNFVNDNPSLEVRNLSYVNNIQVIASHDRMVAINGILAIDLVGQIAADTLNGKMYGGAGGQIDFIIGSMLSKGGRSISVLRSTTGGGAASRILPRLETGTVASVPWTFTDYVVTENGIAKLWGKSLRQRAEELIAVAHPDFRSELRKRAAMAI